jgi:hypothetical protein
MDSMEFDLKYSSSSCKNHSFMLFLVRIWTRTKQSERTQQSESTRLRPLAKVHCHDLDSCCCFVNLNALIVFVCMCQLLSSCHMDSDTTIRKYRTEANSGNVQKVCHQDSCCYFVDFLLEIEAQDRGP